MLKGQSKKEYQKKYMKNYMCNYRKNKQPALSGQKQRTKNAPESTTLSAKVLTNSNAGLNKVLTDEVGLNIDRSSDVPADVMAVVDMVDEPPLMFKYPPRPAGISDNQYAMICVKVKAERGAQH